MAERLPAYVGVIQAMAMAEQHEQHEREHGRPVGPTTNGRTPASGFEGVKVIPLTPELAAGGMAALGLTGVVDYDTSGD